MIWLILFALLSSGKWTEAAGHKLFMILNFLFHKTDVHANNADMQSHIIWLTEIIQVQHCKKVLFILIADELSTLIWEQLEQAERI